MDDNRRKAGADVWDAFVTGKLEMGLRKKDGKRIVVPLGEAKASLMQTDRDTEKKTHSLAS